MNNKWVSVICGVIIVMLCHTVVYAEYGVAPLDNQIEAQIFEETNQKAIFYNSVSIDGDTLTIDLSYLGNRDVTAYYDANVKVLKMRLNQLYEQAGSPKRITRVVYYYQGKQLTRARIAAIKAAEEASQNETNREIQKMTDSTRQLIDKATKLEVCRVKEAKIYEEREKIINSYQILIDAQNNPDIIWITIYEFFQDHNLIAIEALDHNRDKVILRAGDIPDGMANLWEDNRDGGGQYLKLSTLYKSGKRNGIAREYDEYGGVVLSVKRYVNDNEITNKEERR